LKIFDLKVGFECNNDCIHCVISDKLHHPKLSLNEIKNIIDNHLDVDQFIITGGEPTIRKDIIDIVKYIHDKNKLITLQTNGRMLSNINFAKEIEPYINIFLIAIHSSVESYHNIISGTKSFNETINGLKNIYNIDKNKVITQTVISKLNGYLLYNTYNFIQNKFPGVKMNMTFPHQMGNAKKNSILIPKYSDIKYEINKCLKDFGELISTEAIPLCYINPFINKITYSENIVYDNGINISGYDKSIGGEVGEYSNYILQDKIKSEKCNKCFYNNKCVGVWKEYKEISNDLDLIPIQKENITISVRTKYYNIFKEMFFDSFIEHYKDYIPDLHVYVDANYHDHNQEDYDKYKNISLKYGFKLYFVERTLEEVQYFENHYSHMLLKSIENHNGRVISFDDDIIFNNPNLFKIINQGLDKKPIVSLKYIGTNQFKENSSIYDFKYNTAKECISSFMFAVDNNKLQYTIDDFAKHHYRCDGIDTVEFSMNHLDDIYYMDKELEYFIQIEPLVTKYFTHIGSQTWHPDMFKRNIDYSKLDNRIK